MSTPQGQPTQSTGGSYNPAAVRVRVRVEGAGTPGALPGPGSDVVMQGPGSGGSGPGSGSGGVSGPPFGSIPHLPLIGAAPYSKVGHVARPADPTEVAQALREAGVWDLLSQLNEEQKRLVIRLNIMERRDRREGIYAGERATAKQYEYKRPNVKGLGVRYEIAEGITHEEFLKDRALGEKEIERHRAIQTRIEDAATGRAGATFQRAHAVEAARIISEGRKEREKQMKERIKTEGAARSRAEYTKNKAHTQNQTRIHNEAKREQARQFKEAVKQRHNNEVKGNKLMVDLAGIVDYDMAHLIGDGDVDIINEALGGHLDEFAAKRLRAERKLRSIRTLSQRHSAYGAFFIASAQLNPVQTLQRVILNSAIRSGPVGAAIGTSAAIALSVEPVIRQTIKTFGQKGLPLNQDYHYFFAEQTTGFFTLEEQKRHDLGLSGRIADPDFGYEPIEGTSMYNSQQYANTVRLSKLPDQEKARRLN